MSPLVCMVARDCRIGIGEKSQGKDYCWLREELTAGNVLGESQAAMEAEWYCWVMHRGWNHYCSLSLSPYTEDGQLTNREKLQRGWPFECLTGWAIEKDPNQGAFWVPVVPRCKEGSDWEAFWMPATRG